MIKFMSLSKNYIITVSIMEAPVYTEFEIDIAGIWQYECNQFLNHQDERKEYIELYYFLQPFFLQAKHEPFLSWQDVESGKADLDRYDNYFK